MFSYPLCGKTALCRNKLALSYTLPARGYCDSFWHLRQVHKRHAFLVQFYATQALFPCDVQVLCDVQENGFD